MIILLLFVGVGVMAAFSVTLYTFIFSELSPDRVLAGRTETSSAKECLMQVGRGLDLQMVEEKAMAGTASGLPVYLSIQSNPKAPGLRGTLGMSMGARGWISPHFVVDDEPKHRPRPLVLAAFEKKIGRAWDGCVKVCQSLGVKEGRLVAEFPLIGGDAVLQRALRCLELAEELAEALHTPTSLRKLCVRRIESHGSVELREQCLGVLVDGFPHSPETQKALLVASNDDDPFVRFLASNHARSGQLLSWRKIALGPKHPASLRMLALCSLRDAMPPSEFAPIALKAFTGEQPSPSLGPLVPELELLLERWESTLRRQRGRLHEGLKSLWRRHPRRARALFHEAILGAPFKPLLEHGKSHLVQWSLSQFEGLALPVLEEPLLACLKHPVGQVQMSAIRALGSCGTPDAIPALEERARSCGPTMELAIEESIAQISGRIQPAQRGALSVSSDAKGSLSLSKDRSGGISVGD